MLVWGRALQHLRAQLSIALWQNTPEQVANDTHSLLGSQQPSNGQDICILEGNGKSLARKNVTANS